MLTLVLGTDIDNISDTPQSYVMAPDKLGLLVVARWPNERVRATVGRNTGTFGNVVLDDGRAHVSRVVLNAVTNEMPGTQVRSHDVPTDKPDPGPLTRAGGRSGPHRHDDNLSRQKASLLAHHALERRCVTKPRAHRLERRCGRRYYEQRLAGLLTTCRVGCKQGGRIVARI